MSRRLVLVGALMLGLAGCAPPWSSSAVTRSASTTGDTARVAAALRGAQGLVFANQYHAADAAYASLVATHPASAGAHAAYALFLNDEHSFAEALRQAQLAVAAGGRDAYPAAVLCRVRDWSNRLDDAIAAGRRAVQLDDRQPAGHLYLAEALADHGDTTAAEQQITRAAQLIGPAADAYDRAELARERANLAHDLGKPDQQLVDLTAARDAQPGWVERSSELAQFYLDQGKLDLARSTLQTVITLAPDDPGPLVSLGSVAVFEGDFATAATVLHRAVPLDPNDSGLLDFLAEVDVAQGHDPAAAQRELLASLRLNPGDEQAVAYLLALGRATGSDQAAIHDQINEAVSGDRGPREAERHRTPPDPVATQALHRATALAAVNQERALAGLPPVREDDRLSTSAEAHSEYWLFNNASASVANLGIHKETPGLLGFVGVNAWDRAVAWGYPNRRIGEDITHRGDAVDAVGDWVNSVYHRFPIMRPDLEVIGYADVVIGPLPMQDMEFGFGPPTDFTPVAFPADGQVNVPAVFIDNELPDPVPAGAPRTTGSPVTVTFSPLQSVRVSSFTVAGPDGAALPAYVLPPTVETENSASLLTVSPLSAHTRYTAHLSAQLNGHGYERTWSFTTV